MEIVLVLVVGALNIVCFFVGCKLGQKVGKGEPIETPTLNPVKAIKEHTAKREADKEAEAKQKELDAIFRNIENYDGTGQNQEDIPR